MTTPDGLIMHEQGAGSSGYDEAMREVMKWANAVCDPDLPNTPAAPQPPHRPEFMNQTYENAALRGITARLCRAVSQRMEANEPTQEDQIELKKTYEAACEFLNNAHVHSQIIESFVDKFDAITGFHPENEHEEAENWLLDYLRMMGASKIADAFKQAKNRNRGFWYS